MGTASLSKDTIVSISGREYCLLRKFDGFSWQLEDTRTGQILTYEETKLLQMYAEGVLKFPLQSANIQMRPCRS